MLLPDVNVLLAGFRSDHAHHRPARRFLQSARAGSEVLGLSDVVLAAVLRLATNPRVFVAPDTTAPVIDYVDALLEPPGQLLHAGAAHWKRFTDLARALQISANIVPDCYLAALSIGHAAELVTFDRGFARYRGLRWRCLLDV